MKANKILDNLEIDFELVTQDNPTKRCDDAAQERGLQTNQIVKSLILERHVQKGDKENTELLHVLLPGDREISEKKFGENHLVSPSKSKELSGFESGTVHPLSTELKHFVDYRIFDKDLVSFTIGEETRGVILKSSAFLEALQKTDFEFKVEDISLTDSRDIEKLESKNLDTQQARFISENGLTPIYRELEEYKDSEILEALQESRRYELDLDSSVLEKLIQASENINHLQKVIQHFTETGEVLESSDFDIVTEVEKVLDNHSDAVDELNAGKKSVENFLVGQVMQQTNGQADATEVKKILGEKI